MVSTNIMFIYTDRKLTLTVNTEAYDKQLYAFISQKKTYCLILKNIEQATEQLNHDLEGTYCNSGTR